MPQTDSASPEPHLARLLRGTAAVLGFIQTRFPRSVVELLPKNSHDVARSTHTFEIRNGGGRILLRVTDQVLDQDFDGVRRLLQQLQVARAVRVARTGAVLVVTTHDVTVEPKPEPRS